MNRRQLLCVAAGLLALVAALHARVLFGGMSFGLRDHLILDLPIRTFLRSSLLAGRVPQWWDGIGLGVPFAANPVHQAWAPLTWLCALLTMPLGVDVEPAVYLFVAALGTALLAARLGADPLGSFLAGSSVASGGYFNSLAVNGNLPYVAWVPWVAWAAARLTDLVAGGPGRVAAAAALAGLAALQLGGGEPATVATAGLLALAVVLTRWTRPTSTAIWLGAAAAAAVALAAVQIVPAVLVAGSTDRAGGLDLAVASEWSLHPARLLELLWPRLLGDPVHPAHNLARLFSETTLLDRGPAWSFSVFAGAPVFVLALLGARGRLRYLLLAAGGFLVLAMGRHTPVFALLRVVFPLERYARFPEKHVVGALVLLAALAGAGLTQLRAGPRKGVVALMSAAGLLGGAVVALVAADGSALEWLSGRASILGVKGLEVEAALRATVAGGALSVGALLAAAGGVLLLGRSGPSWAGALLVLVAVVAPGAWDVAGFTVLVPRSEVASRPALLRLPLDEGAVLPRLYRPRSTGEAPPPGEALPRFMLETAALNTASRFGFQTLPGNDAAFDKEYEAFWSTAPRGVQVPDLGVLLGVRWLVLDEFSALPPYPGPVVARAHHLVAIDLAGARPRAFVTRRWVEAGSRERALQALLLPGRAQDPALVSIEGAAPAPGFVPGPAGSACALRQDAPETVELACDSPFPGYAVLLEAESAGWTATVDGLAAKVKRADGLFRAVFVPAGAHHIRFSYLAPGLLVGAAISGLAIFGVVLMVIVARRRESTLAK